MLCNSVLCECLQSMCHAAAELNCSDRQSPARPRPITSPASSPPTADKIDPRIPLQQQRFCHPYTDNTVRVSSDTIRYDRRA